MRRHLFSGYWDRFEYYVEQHDWKREKDQDYCDYFEDVDLGNGVLSGDNGIFGGPAVQIPITETRRAEYSNKYVILTCPKCYGQMKVELEPNDLLKLTAHVLRRRIWHMENNFWRWYDIRIGYKLKNINMAVNSILEHAKNELSGI